VAVLKQAAVVYHSGTGGTRTVAELAARLIGQLDAGCCRVRLIEAGRTAGDVCADADLFVFGYPTFYLKPSPTIVDFLDSLPRLAAPKPAFVFTTKALYAENSLRRFAKMLRVKNIRVFGTAEIKSPASDGVLNTPPGFAPSFLQFERRAAAKISAMAQCIGRALDARMPRPRLPLPKWYTPLSQTLQVLYFNRFERNRFRLRANPARCTACGRCADDCPRRAWLSPSAHIPADCDLCLRCVHHCPERAIGWDGHMIDRPRLTPELHDRLKQALGRELFPR
jgi:ferredoxin/flavodoxin